MKVPWILCGALALALAVGIAVGVLIGHDTRSQPEDGSGVVPPPTSAVSGATGLPVATDTPRPKYTADEVIGIVKARPSGLDPGYTVWQVAGSTCDSSIKQYHPEIVSEVNFAGFEAVYQGDGRWVIAYECYACSGTGPCSKVIGERRSVGSFLENGREFIEH